MTDRGAVCWESHLYGSERGWRATLVGMKYCGTAGKPGGKQRTQSSSYSQGSLQPTRTRSLLPRVVADRGAFGVSAGGADGSIEVQRQAGKTLPP